MFDEALTDTISIVTTDGKQYHNIKASVQREKIYIVMKEGEYIHIDEGDQVIRDLPDNYKEVFTIINPGFYRGFDEMPDNYQMQVRRNSRYEAARFLDDPDTLVVKSKIFDALIEGWNQEEFKTLCFAIGMQYDHLAGEGLQAKMRELVTLCYRQDKLEVLIEEMKRQRPNVIS